MTTTRRAVCIEAAKKVFGNRTDIEKIAQDYIESALSRFEITYQIDGEKIPLSLVMVIAECAGWYVSDNKILTTKSNDAIGNVRQRIAEHLHIKFPNMYPYAISR